MRERCKHETRLGNSISHVPLIGQGKFSDFCVGDREAGLRINQLPEGAPAKQLWAPPWPPVAPRGERGQCAWVRTTENQRKESTHGAEASLNSESTPFRSEPQMLAQVLDVGLNWHL